MPSRPDKALAPLLPVSVLARPLPVPLSAAGVFGEIWPLRQGAGIANTVTLLLFVLTLLSRVLAGAVKREGTP